ncbi:MAG: sigma-70 family RNA polymerase sigma factor [Alistipes sp.]|jgi:RNA polymerase sigma-70 factor (ECF subfamily)|nr:sigma-70 family RNA polymerase sigma factor [Alistipes sp.]
MVEVGEIKFGDEETVRSAFQAFYHPLCFYAARLLGEDDHAVDDTVQEVFLRVWERAVAFDSRGAMRAYLYSSVYNACVNRLRSAGLHRRHHSIIHDNATRQGLHYEEQSIAADRIEAEVVSKIFSAIEQLPPECRKVFELSYINGLSVDGVACELDISPNTVKTQRSRAKRLLRQRLRELYPLMTMLFMISEIGP